MMKNKKNKLKKIPKLFKVKLFVFLEAQWFQKKVSTLMLILIMETEPWTHLPGVFQLRLWKSKK